MLVGLLGDDVRSLEPVLFGRHGKELVWDQEEEERRKGGGRRRKEEKAKEWSSVIYLLVEVLKVGVEPQTHKHHGHPEAKDQRQAKKEK